MAQLWEVVGGADKGGNNSEVFGNHRRDTCFFPFVLSFFSSFIYSQNKIYCDDGTYDGSVVQITKEKIFFRKSENPDIDYTVKREKVKLRVLYSFQTE